MNEQLTKLFEGVELTEETKTSISEAFQSAVDAAVETEKDTLEEHYQQVAEEYGEYLKEEYKQLTDMYIQEEVIPTVTKYVEYATEEFVKENKPVIESNLKVELAESFLKGVSTITEQFNVKLPETNVADKITALEESMASANERLNATLTENATLKAQLTQVAKDIVIGELSKDLTESDKEKFKQGVAKVEFIDEAQYKTATKAIFESYFPKVDDKNKEQITEKTRNLPNTGKDASLDSWIADLLERV